MERPCTAHRAQTASRGSSTQSRFRRNTRLTAACRDAGRCRAMRKRRRPARARAQSARPASDARPASPAAPVGSAPRSTRPRAAAPPNPLSRKVRSSCRPNTAHEGLPQRQRATDKPFRGSAQPRARIHEHELLDDGFRARRFGPCRNAHPEPEGGLSSWGGSRYFRARPLPPKRRLAPSPCSASSAIPVPDRVIRAARSWRWAISMGCIWGMQR